MDAVMASATRRHRADRRPERARLGAGGTAPLARGRAQGAAPLRQGGRGRRAAPTSTRSTRPCCAPRAQQIHQGVGALELVGLPAAATCCAPARPRCSAASPSRTKLTPRARRRPRARVVRAARLPGAHARRQARSRRCRCSRSTARCRKRPAPSASIRPTCGRSTGAGASCRERPDVAARQPPTPTARAELEGAAAAR